MRKLHERRWREKLGLFFCEGEDLVEAATAEPVELLVAGENVEPGLLALRHAATRQSRIEDRDAHAEGRQFDAQGFGHAGDGELAGRVGGEGAVRDQPVKRRGVDDVAVSAVAHLAREGDDAVVNAANVDRHQPVELVRRHLVEHLELL